MNSVKITIIYIIAITIIGVLTILAVPSFIDYLANKIGENNLLLLVMTILVFLGVVISVHKRRERN